MVGSACGAQAAVVSTTGHDVQPGALSNIVPHGGNGATGGSKGGGAADAGGVVDGAPSGNFDNSPHPGNGAVVTTPPVGGQAGGAVVELPIPAQNHGNGNGNGNGGGGSAGGDLGQDLPVTLPSAPAPAQEATVPEPSSIALMMAGVLGALGVARRRKH
jgi:hypothetical protein